MRAYAEKRLSDAYSVRQILLRRAKLNHINSKSPSKYLWPGYNIIAEDFVSKNFDTPNFAGMEAVGRPAASNPFSYIYQASGSFVVSNVTLPNGATQCPKSYPTYRASQWIGIGGMNPQNYGWVTDQDLYQAGVVYNINCSSFPYNPIISVAAFWEDYSCNGGIGGHLEEDLAHLVNPGDTMDVTVMSMSGGIMMWSINDVGNWFDSGIWINMYDANPLWSAEAIFERGYSITSGNGGIATYNPMPQPPESTPSFDIYFSNLSYWADVSSLDYPNQPMGTTINGIPLTTCLVGSDSHPSECVVTDSVNVRKNDCEFVNWDLGSPSDDPNFSAVSYTYVGTPKSGICN